MKLLIIGSSVLDKIVQGDKTSESAGGIYHSVFKINLLRDKNDLIGLCTQTDKKTFDLFNSVYHKCNKKFFNEVAEIPHVKLEEVDTGYRKETYCSKAEPLKLIGIDYNNYDGIMINMITGYELELSELSEIRKNTNALIYFDVHTLSRKSEKEGLREFYLIPEFELWASNIDIIQVNEFEMLSLFNISDEREVAKKLFAAGVKIFIVTKGEKGSVAYFFDKNEISFYFVKANEIKNVSTIGCGDYFGASFFYNYLKTNNAILSLNFATKEVENSLLKRLNAIK
jgi:hypothetical protein